MTNNEIRSAIAEATTLEQLAELHWNIECELAQHPRAIENDPEGQGNYASEARDWLDRFGYSERLDQIGAA